MSRSASFAAVDLGASSGRVMLGSIAPGQIDVVEVNRFRNGPITLPDGLYWDILGLYQDILGGLRDAARQATDLSGLAIDSWAVDYGLLDADGSLLANPRHYRDDRTSAVIPKVHEAVPPERLYTVNGLQFLPFNTMYQLAADRRVQPGVQALLIPDLLGYWLSGERVTEQTNASTTGLLDARTGRWATDVTDALGMPPGLFPDLTAPGTIVGPVLGRIAYQTGIPAAATLSTVGSHDTASAVVGVPAKDPQFGYISCGTWGLVGVELDTPVLTEQSRESNFTNERGVDGTVRYLRNVMGLWLLAESIRSWQAKGHDVHLADLLDGAAALPAGGPTFDPDDPVFLPPGDMPTRIIAACEDSDRAVPSTPVQLVRCILDSLAARFAITLSDAQRLSGRRIDVVHIVGGGSQNELLCQLVADAADLPVVAGPVEATALGNLLVQARTHGILSGDLWSLRAELRGAVRTVSYLPSRHRGVKRT